MPTLRLKLIATTLSGALHGHGRRAAAVLRDLSRSGVGLQPDLRGERHRHAADRRHLELARPGDRRGPAGHVAAGCHGDDLLGAQPADRRADAGRLRRRWRRTGIIGLVRGRVRSERRAGMRSRARCSKSPASASASAASSRWKAIDLAVQPRRTRRADRPQRLRQEHAGELHVRHAAPRDGQRALRRPTRWTACRRTNARGSASRAASSCRGRSPP